MSLNPTSSQAVRELPDLAVCRVKRSGLADLVVCLVAGSGHRPHAERHAFDMFCFHPQWPEILAQSGAGR